MKQKVRISALCAVFLMALSFSAVALADGTPEYVPEPVPVDATPVPLPASTPEPAAASNPFTPPGTGTVIDNATNAAGKEFFTIESPEGNIFYLIIDRQREQENVYFLDAVTEKDLLALAEKAGVLDESVLPTPVPILTPEPVIVVEQHKGGGSGLLVMVILVVLLGGGAGYYFKIYRPKQEQGAMGAEYEEYESEEEDAGEYLTGKDGYPDEDTYPWDEYENGEGDET